MTNNEARPSPPGKPDPQLAALERELDKARTQILELEWKLQHAESALAQMRASTSWRLTAPLRALALLSGRSGGGASSRLPRPLAAVVSLAAEAISRAAGSAATPAGPPAGAGASLDAAKEALRSRLATEFDSFMAGQGRIELPAPAAPKVSVVLVLWNQAALTFACLRALERETEVPIEVVIVDNASTDRTAELLARVGGARVLRNADNMGFLLAVNQGVAASSGQHVLLLNNDAIVREGGLAAAVGLLEGDVTVGAVGARVILPDGRLQEAGSIVWNDGSCLGYLRGAAPETPEAMFRRDVDYCSGVFLLFRRSHFEELGGFDEAFVPAYYEEVDFCLRLWARGLRVVYDPRVVVDHLEFGSSVKSEQAIALQQRNRAVLVERHRGALARQSAPGAANILRARMRDSGRGRVLILDDRVPLPSLGSGYPRAERLLHEVAATGRFVTFYPLQSEREVWRETWSTLPPGVEVAMGLGKAGLGEFLREREGYYETLLVSRVHNMEILARARSRRPGMLAGLRVIYDAEAIFAQRDATKARVFGQDGALRAAETRMAEEVALAATADEVVAVSEFEAAQFRVAARGRIRVLGHALEPAPTTPSFDERQGLLFVGPLDAEDSPNTDSVKWFVTEVLPALRQHPGAPVALTCAGRTGARTVEDLRGPALRLLGRLQRLDAEYARHRVFVAPTRFAGGIPLKVYEAAAHGISVVATGLLARQLGWSDGVELLVADDAAGFAAAVARLHADAALWQRIRDAALARVAEDCSSERFRAGVRAMLGD
ncbi:MAG: glycosyltransferase [Acetobacteraceae bacterium]|nr:glycosyltransferase [Acetobacteraceae bacterium]